MVQNLEDVIGRINVDESMSAGEHSLFNKLKDALLSKDNLSNHSNLMKHYNFEYADYEVLLGYVRHSCLGCCPYDVAFIKDCYHRPGNIFPCSLWLYRGGKVHRDEIPLFKEAYDRGYAVGSPDEDRRITEIFLYITGKDGQLMFRWIPQRKASISEVSAAYLAKRVFYLIRDEGIIPNGWENVPANEG
jgi:hypothetical protein